MTDVTLSRGLVAIVDEVDLPLVLSLRPWFALRKTWGIGWYAVRNVKRADGTRGTMYMHKLLLPGVRRVDHWNGDGLDNRRENLRPATPSQNAANQPKHRGLSQFKGVSWDAVNNRWRVSIQFQGRSVNLGRFDDERAAAAAYNASARELFGAFASPNVEEESA